jgi:hypothetical protein
VSTLAVEFAIVQQFSVRRTSGIVASLLLCLLAAEITKAQQIPARFAGAYPELDERRQRLINDWVARFIKTTGQELDAGPFYNDILSLSTKTTFDAVTQALMTTRDTARSIMSLGKMTMHGVLGWTLMVAPASTADSQSAAEPLLRRRPSKRPVARPRARR